MKWKHISPFFLVRFFLALRFQRFLFSLFSSASFLFLYEIRCDLITFSSLHTVLGEIIWNDKNECRVHGWISIPSGWKRQPKCAHIHNIRGTTASLIFFLFFLFSFSVFFVLLMNLLCLNWTRYESLPKSIRSSVLQYFCSCLQFSRGKFPSTAQPKKLLDSYSYTSSSIKCEIA